MKINFKNVQIYMMVMVMSFFLIHCSGGSQNAFLSEDMHKSFAGSNAQISSNPYGGRSLLPEGTDLAIDADPEPEFLTAEDCNGPEDVNCDGCTNGLDVAVITSSANFGFATGEAEEPRADTNGDGTVNGLDVALVTNSSVFGNGNCDGDDEFPSGLPSSYTAVELPFVSPVDPETTRPWYKEFNDDGIGVSVREFYDGENLINLGSLMNRNGDIKASTINNEEMVGGSYPFGINHFAYCYSPEAGFMDLRASNLAGSARNSYAIKLNNNHKMLGYREGSGDFSYEPFIYDISSNQIQFIDENSWPKAFNDNETIGFDRRVDITYASGHQTQSILPVVRFADGTSRLLDDRTVSEWGHHHFFTVEAINNNDIITGNRRFHNYDTHSWFVNAMIWYPDGSFVELPSPRSDYPMLYLRDINNENWSIGSLSHDNQNRHIPILVDPDLNIYEIGRDIPVVGYAEDYTARYAFDINNEGQVLIHGYSRELVIGPSGYGSYRYTTKFYLLTPEGE